MPPARETGRPDLFVLLMKCSCFTPFKSSARTAHEYVRPTWYVFAHRCLILTLTLDAIGSVTIEGGSTHHQNNMSYCNRSIFIAGLLMSFAASVVAWQDLSPGLPSIPASSGTLVYAVRDLPPGTPKEGHGKDAKKYGYRIPSLLTTARGTLLAFVERRLGLHDHAQNDIVLRRSVDGGKTWGGEIVAYEDGMNSINDPLTVQLESGRILMMFARFPYGRHARDSGWIKMADLGYGDLKNNVLTFTTFSDDDGLTWSSPVDISRQVKPERWVNANSPGAMIQLQRGPYKGRIITPLWGTLPPEKKGGARQWEIAVVHSDDNGNTWVRSKSLVDPEEGYPNECQIAEAANGDLVIIARNQGGATWRKKSISTDGGATWPAMATDKALPSVACMGSIVRGPEKGGGSWDLYASFPSKDGRKNGQLAISRDNGRTFQIKKIIKGGFSYSTTQISPDGKSLLCLYETENTLRFLSLPLTDFDSTTASTRQPNVLFIVSEDNSEQIGCYGDTRVHTPHLDSLAAAGVRYDRAYVPYSVCSPSRAAFLTGLYTRQTGHIGLATHRFAFYKDFKTMPAYFQGAGYYTGFIGKTHVNPERVVEDFVDFRGIKAANFNSDFSIKEYAVQARTIFDKAQTANKPFLAIINYSDAHRRFVDVSKAGFPTKRVEGDIPPLPWIDCDTPRLREEMRDYLSCMNRLDEGIGLVLRHLEELGQRENTLVIYMADHGADFPRGKTTCYEGGVKVPLIVNFPKSFRQGHVEKAMVSTMDILPSMLQDAGIDIPRELVGTPLQSLQDPQAPRRKYIHTFNTGSSANLLYLTFGIRDDRFKLIYNPVRAQNQAAISRYKNSAIPEALWRPDYIDPPEFELYDLQTDPHELRNIANLPGRSGTRDSLFQAMQEFQKQINDPFLDPSNIDFFIKEMRDPSRQPKKRSQETWSHLERFYN